MSASVASSATSATSTRSSATTSRKRRHRRKEFRFRLIRCMDPNRSVSRILELKNNSQQLVRPSLFQLQDVLDSAVLTALLEVFQYFASEGIQWRTLDILEDVTSNATTFHTEDASRMLHELLRLANEASLFQEIRLAIRTQHGPFLPSIERNTRLVRLRVELRRSPEDVQSLITLLKFSKTLTLLDLKCHGLNIQDFSEGLANNSTLKSLSLTSTPGNSFQTSSNSSTIQSMMTTLLQYPALRLQKLALAGEPDDEISSALESLLLAQPELEMINLNYDGADRALSPQAYSRGYSPFDSFFQRLAYLTPSHTATATATATANANANANGSSNQEQAPQQQHQQHQPQQPQQPQPQSLDHHLIENGPLITIGGTNMYRATRDQVAVVKRALIKYPKLRFANAALPGDIGYENLMNHCGRYLIYDSKVPLGLWPIALDRAACLESHKRQRSSVIYELLHGGVFAARETYASI